MCGVPRSTAKSFDKPHAVSVHSAYFMDAPSNVPKDPRGEPYTEDVVRATARAQCSVHGRVPRVLQDAGEGAVSATPARILGTCSNCLTEISESLEGNGRTPVVCRNCGAHAVSYYPLLPMDSPRFVGFELCFTVKPARAVRNKKP